MLSNEEREEIRQEVLRDLIAIEDQVAHNAGSYGYLCCVGGSPVFAHTPVGPVIRTIRRP